eukprot:6734547-Prymnesium_polylepis.1
MSDRILEFSGSLKMMSSAIITSLSSKSPSSERAFDMMVSTAAGPRSASGCRSRRCRRRCRGWS